MTDVQILAGDLTANLTERIVSGLLLPFGELGNTNLGKFKVPGPGVIGIPPDVSVLMANEGHDQLEPRAAFTTVTESEQGVFASFRVGKNPEGDDLLARIDKAKKGGKPMALSVEVKGIRIKNGVAVGGKLAGAAFVDRGAFPSAALLAADVGEEEPAEPAETEQHTEDTFTDENGVTWKRVVDVTTETTPTETTTTTVETEEVINPENPDEQKEDAVAPAATAPDSLQAHHGSAPIPGQGTKLADLFAKLAEFQRTRDKGLFAELAEEFNAGGNLYAALNDVKTTGSGGLATTMTQPQWLGELWGKRRFTRRYIPLFAHGDLTGFSVAGWKWGTKPVMGEWTGNKSNVPSNTPTVTPYTKDAHGWAGGHDIDRRFRDFEVPGFWESYWLHMADSYEELADTAAIAAALAAATPVTAGEVPTDIDPGLAALVDGALAVLDYGLPTFAVVSKPIWRSLLLTPKDKVTEYLTQSLGLEEGSTLGFKIVPARGSDLEDQQVLVGIGNSVEILELPGAPIRVEGLDMVKGGVDASVFGYSTEVIHEALGLALVEIDDGES